jgi:hypothetical protein
MLPNLAVKFELADVLSWFALPAMKTFYPTRWNFGQAKKCRDDPRRASCPPSKTAKTASVTLQPKNNRRGRS